MLFNLPYLTVANYSPRGRADLSVRSRSLCDGLKNGNKDYVNRAIEHLQNSQGIDWHPFLNGGVTLVPIPRSSLLQDGALWPAMVIASCLKGVGLAGDVAPIIRRERAVRKSSIQPNADARPSVTEHKESFEVSGLLIPPIHITLVDDVLTLGRTGMACAQKLHEVFPRAEIRFFSVVRTQSLVQDIERLVDVSVGNIHYNPDSSRTSREP